jgi:hypothetical protein
LKYTCIKSGKKLVWNKGVPIGKSSPAPAASTAQNAPQETMQPSRESAFSPWDSNASAKAINDAAQANFRLWVNQQKKLNTSHSLILDPRTPKQRAQNFSKVDQLGTQLFSQFFNGKSATVIGYTEDWVLEQLNKNGGKYTQCTYNAGNGALNYCLERGKTLGFVVKGDQDYSASNPGMDGSSLLAHEYFHLVQYQLAKLENKQDIKSGDQSSSNLFPAWLAEGSANFVGFSVSAMALGATYWEGRKAMFNYAPPEPSINKNKLEDYEIRNGPGNNSPTYPYIAGQLASEFIVASVGFQKFLDIWANFAVTNDFEKSFEKAVGLSKEDFYSKFEKARVNLGLPPVSWKLVCLTNYPLDQLPQSPGTCSYSPSQNNSQSNQTQAQPVKPSAVDRTTDVSRQGCSYGEPSFKNSFGTFSCEPDASGNNLWKKTG